MYLDFIKMQACGNDYIYVDCLASPLQADARELARKLAPRRRSVGSDGLVLICRSESADAKMLIFNADGSEALTCGNALRCVARLLFESGFAKKSRIKIETASGVREVLLLLRDGKIERLCADMGVASVGGMKIYEARGEKHEAVRVTLGNDHAVILVPDTEEEGISKTGELLRKNAEKDGINVEFCSKIGENTLKMRAFERGSGETLSCGSGACACVAALAARGLVNVRKPVRVITRGGELCVFCGQELRMRLCGEAEMVFEGRVEL